jgi:hypothetical protein
LVKALTIEICHRGAAKLDLPLSVFGYECREAQALRGKIFSILQAKHRRDTEFLLEPRYVFNTRVLANEQGRKDFTHLWSPTAAVCSMGVSGKWVIEVRHAGKVEKPAWSVKAD